MVGRSSNKDGADEVRLTKQVVPTGACNKSHVTSQISHAARNTSHTKSRCAHASAAAIENSEDEGDEHEEPKSLHDGDGEPGKCDV